MSNRSTFGLRCCCCRNPMGSGERFCSDGANRGAFYREVCRDCFWPMFAHPTWLCCQTLYGCCCRNRARIPE